MEGKAFFHFCWPSEAVVQRPPCRRREPSERPLPVPSLARDEARARSSRESAGRKMRARARRELKIEKGKESWSGEERKHGVTVVIVAAFVEVLFCRS